MLTINDRIVKAAFRRHKTDAPELMRIYYLCNYSFSQKSGLFTLQDLADLLSQYGYKSLKPNQGGNRHKKIKDLAALLRAAPELFIESKPGIFRTISKHKINKKRPDNRNIDLKLFHKDNKREFYDLIIGIQADGCTVDYKTLSSKTGFTVPRICQAAKGNHLKGHILKVNNDIVISSHKTQQQAITERFNLYFKTPAKYRVFTKIRKYAGQWHIITFGANSYTSDMSTPEYGECRPILNRKHESTVFYVAKMMNNNSLKSNRLLCFFKTGQENLFYQRQYVYC